MTTWHERILAAHLAVTSAVSHGARMRSSRYFVWQEDGYNNFYADGLHAEKTVTGTTDLFTFQEFDPWRDLLEESFDTSGIAWELNSVQFEPDTQMWHYEWTWEV